MTAASSMARPRRTGPRIWTHLPLVIVAVATFFPFFAMVALSLQMGHALELPGSLLPMHPNLDAYRHAVSSSQLPRWLMNTTLYALISVVLVLLFASMAAYAFAKKRFFGRNVLFWLLVSMLMVPYHLILIPQFILIMRLGLVDTLAGLILPTLANTQALFLMRQFIMGIPDELIEAARVDGAGELRLFFQIVLPQCKPILATLGVFIFLWHWNDFLWPLVMTRSESNYVLTLGLFSLQAQEVSLAVTMATAVVTLAPILVVYLSLQRYFVGGAMTSGLK